MRRDAVEAHHGIGGVGLQMWLAGEPFRWTLATTA